MFHAYALSEIIYSKVNEPQLIIISKKAKDEIDIDKVINTGNEYLKQQNLTTINIKEIEYGKLQAAGSPKTHLTYMKKKYKIHGSKEKRYINVSKNKVYLKDIRGKYRYCKS